jgi:hypothetical protein
MPALTHGRVKNGFNLFPRSIKYAQPSCNKDTKEEAAARKGQGYNQQAEYDPNGNKVCVNAQRGLCCGSAIQPRNLGPGHLFQRYRVPTKPCNRKHASNVVTGRSFAAKRAIARRSANCNTSHHITGLGTVTFNVYGRFSDASTIGENPYLFDTSVSDFQIGSSVNIIKIRDYTIKLKAIVQGDLGPASNFGFYEITANYDLIYNTIVTNSDASIFKIQKFNNIISKPVYWTLVGKSSITVNQTSIILSNTPGATPMEGDSTAPNFNFTITPDYNVSTNCCCLLPTVTYSGPRNAYRMPCSGGLTRRTLLQPCTNPTVKK